MKDLDGDYDDDTGKGNMMKMMMIMMMIMITIRVMMLVLLMMMMMMMLSYMCGCCWWWWSCWSSAFRNDAFLSTYDCKSQQARCDYILLWLFRTRALHNWQVSSSIVDAVTWSRSVWAGSRRQFYLSRECKKKYCCAAPDATFHCWVALHWASTVAKYHGNKSKYGRRAHCAPCSETVGPVSE